MSANKLPPEYIPRSAGKARTWAAELPITNLGETTRCLYMGLVDFNQSRVSPSNRIDIADTLRAPAKIVLKNLQRHLSHRAFPLPKKSQRIFELKQSLLLELAGAYQLAAIDMLTTSSIIKKPLLKAIYSAMDYMAQVLLQSFMVYAKTRDTLWHDMHHLYLLACENKLENIVVVQDKKQFSTISDIYKYVNLLALANPYSLRQGEIEKLDQLFRVIFPLVKIHLNADHIKTELTYIIHLNSDTHAALVPVSDILNSPTIRVLDLSSLIQKLDKYISTIEDQDTPSDYYFFTDFGISLAKRLVFHFTRVRNRGFNRYVKNEEISVVTGLVDVVTVINDSHKVEVTSDPDDDDYIFAALNYDVAPNGSRIEKNVPDSDESTVLVQTWHIENSSVGGYGICWRENLPSGARVGEIIALKAQGDNDDTWQVGTIRWLEFVKGDGLCAGVEFLAPHIIPVEAIQIINRNVPQTFPMSGLMLPPIDGIRPEPELVFKAQTFKSGDHIKIQQANREETVCLTHRDECTGSFGIFGYSTVTAEKIEEDIEDEDYSVIWGTL